LIKRCVFAGIGSAKGDPTGPGRVWRDPHIICSPSSTGELTSIHAADVVASSDAAASQWVRIAAGLILRQEDLGQASKLWVIGFASVKNDKYVEAFELVVPGPFTTDQPENSIAKLDRWRNEGFCLARKARPPKDKRDHSELPPAIAAVRPHVEALVFDNARDLLTDADAAWQSAAEEYRPMMAAVADSLAPGFTLAALRRRKQIAGAIPDMRPSEESKKKPARRKGEDK
jgi:hypothetical protein